MGVRRRLACEMLPEPTITGGAFLHLQSPWPYIFCTVTSVVRDWVPWVQSGRRSDRDVWHAARTAHGNAPDGAAVVAPG